MLKKIWTSLADLTLEQAWQKHRAVLWTVVLAGVIMVSFAGNMNRGLLETTEGRYAECAREMIETGNFLEPTLDYAPHWTKPPMAYWAMALGMAAAGPGEAGARLGNAAAFLCTGLLTAWLAWRLWGQLAGLAALAVYATSVLPVLGGTFLSTDMLLTLWETLAVCCYLLWAQSDRNSKALLAAMWAAFGLAFLTKGPPGLLPLLAIVPWHVWRFRDARLFNPWGLILFAVLGLGWFGYIMWRHPDLFSYFVQKEVVARVASDDFHRNPEWYKPLVIYAPVLFLGPVHWVWLAKSPKAAWLALPREQRIFLGLWLVLPLVVFCVAKSRLPLYVLPLSIPTTLFLARALAGRSETLRVRTAGAVFAATVLILILARVGLGLFPMPQNMRQLHEAADKTGEGQLVALMKEKAYGLQFYVQGKTTWLGADGGNRGEALNEFLDRASGKFRLVAKERDRTMIEEALRSRGMTGNVHDAGGWLVVTFER